MMFIRNAALQAVVLASSAAVSSAAGASFSYDPDSSVGPTSWGSLPGSSCDGMAQSGIDVQTKEECDEEQVNYLFEPGTCTVENLIFTVNDHVIQGSYPLLADEICTPPRMTIPNIVNGTFEALQFHIHMGSEHALSGQKFGADFHLVHKQVEGGRYAVLGLFLDPAADGEEGNADFSNLVTGWQAVADEIDSACASTTSRNLEQRKLTQRKTQTAFDVYSMVPEGFSTYYYEGSLTTPPCSEVVNWNVVDTPVLLAPADFAAISSYILEYIGESCNSTTIAFANVTARPLQELNGRSVTHKCIGDGSGNKVVAPAPADAAPSPAATPTATPPTASSSAASVAAFVSSVVAMIVSAVWM